jgi:hypothetical protein
MGQGRKTLLVLGAAVMLGLVPSIHVLNTTLSAKTWMVATKGTLTKERVILGRSEAQTRESLDGRGSERRLPVMRWSGQARP